MRSRAFLQALVALVFLAWPSPSRGFGVGAAVYVQTKSVRPRRAPSKKASRVKTVLVRGTALEVVKSRGRWMLVRPPGGKPRGWVHVFYLSGRRIEEEKAQMGAFAPRGSRASPGFEEPSPGSGKIPHVGGGLFTLDDAATVERVTKLDLFDDATKARRSLLRFLKKGSLGPFQGVKR